jgi:hypothetical protein
MKLGPQAYYADAESSSMTIFAVIIASRVGANRLPIGNNIRSNGLQRQVDMRREFSRSVVRIKPIMPLL